MMPNPSWVWECVTIVGQFALTLFLAICTGFCRIGDGVDDFHNFNSVLYIDCKEYKVSLFFFGHDLPYFK